MSDIFQLEVLETVAVQKLIDITWVVVPDVMLMLMMISLLMSLLMIMMLLMRLMLLLLLLMLLLIVLMMLYESTFASFDVPIHIATLFAQLHESHGFCGRSVSTSLLCYWLNSQGTTGHCWGLQHLQLLERTAVSWTALWTARVVLVVQLYTVDHHPCSVHLFVTVYGHSCVISIITAIYKSEDCLVFTSLVPRPSHHPVKVFCCY